MKLNEPSWLHRKFRYDVGRAPGWLINCRGCSGLDLFGIAFSALLFGGAFVLFSGWWIGLLMIKFAFAALSIWYPVELCERLSRARLRRRECVRCGAKGLPESDERCADCSRGL
jgi:hypothetical protein